MSISRMAAFMSNLPNATKMVEMWKLRGYKSTTGKIYKLENTSKMIIKYSTMLNSK